MGIETALLIGAVASAGSAYVAYDAKKDAKKDAAKQAALIKKQEDMVAKEREKQQKEDAARRTRAQGQELLTGTETGITEDVSSTLLGRAR